MLAFRYADGVVMAGDRRATAGNVIAHRRVQKVFAADDFSAVGIFGYGWHRHRTRPALPDRARALRERSKVAVSAWWARPITSPRWCAAGSPMAFQGLVVIPIFCGFDEQEKVGRLYSYDVVGGRTRKPITPRRVRAAATPASSSAPGSGPTSPKVLRSISL